MKRCLAAILLWCLFLSGAVAEVCLPSFESYTAQTPEAISETENEDTITGQYYTDMESVQAYQTMLLEKGFLLSGQWKLPGGEGYDHLDVYAYTWIGKERPASFKMTVGNDNFSTHILIQAASLTDGRVLLGMTRSAQITCFEFIQPSPVPTSTPAPLGICQFCNHGRCRHCGGSGVKKCGICNGSGICVTCNGRKRGPYVPSYTGGSGTYVDCQGCHGDGKCWRCHGSKTEKCGFCDGGVCPYCHGNYLNP